LAPARKRAKRAPAAGAGAAEGRALDLEAGVLTIRRAYAKGKLKTYAKTARSRRRVALRNKVIAALEGLDHRQGAVFPAAGDGRIDINNWRSREWTPALKAADVEHRRIYDMRHTFATWSLAAGMSIFTLAPRMGMSVPVIDATYGHLGRDADGNDRELLDAYDEANGHVVGTNPDDDADSTGSENDETARERGF
jgi:integrase